MSETRVKISSIIENQLPQFIVEEFPLSQEFLKHYYTSIENQGQPLDLLENIDKNIKLENLTDISEEFYLSSDITSYGTIIELYSKTNNFKGLPKKYGFIKVDDEIILYKNSKIDNNKITLTDCVRGFSGTSSIKTTGELVFSTTSEEEHVKDSLVYNLSILFLTQFLYKLKKQISPGFEDKKLYEDLNEYIFISRLKDFYSSKGTDESFNILFKSLYGKTVNVIKPRDYLIRPSDAQYLIANDLVVEVIEGDPTQLNNKTLYQDQIYNIEYSQGTIVDSQYFFKNGKSYYKLSLDSSSTQNIEYSGTIFNKFSIHPKTKIIENVEKGQTHLDVDSTVGFPDSGDLIINLKNGTELIVSYKSKNINQFLGCTNVNQDIDDATDVKLNVYAYVYSDDGQSKIKLRINGVLSDVELRSKTNYFSKGDDCIISTFGIEKNDVLFNNWIFNLPLTYDVETISLKDETNQYLLYELTLYDNHNILKNDFVTLITSDNRVFDTQVQDVTSGSVTTAQTYSVSPKGVKTVLILLDKQNSDSYLNLTNKDIKYRLKKRISRLNVKDKQQLSFNRTNVQNVYLDPYDEGSVYITSPSLPSYSVVLDPSERSVVFNGKVDGYEISFKDNEGKLIGHPFYTGDAIFYTYDKSANLNRQTQTVLDQITQNDNSLGIPSGIYYVKKVDNYTIKLALGRNNIFNNQFIKLSGNVFNNRFQIVDYANQIIDSQKLVRKISLPDDGVSSYPTKPGTTGIFVNGVEVLNYKSKEKIFNGKIQKVDVLGGGLNYDVMNPPVLEFKDRLGSGCKSISSVKGSLKRIDIIDPGFDYIDIPKVQISGGNGKNASAQVNLISVDNIVMFNSEVGVNTITNVIDFYIDHRFRDNEEVIYQTNDSESSPIGGLINGSNYFVDVVGLTSVRLYPSLKDSTLGINTISLTDFGIGDHSFKSKNKKKKISDIFVTNEGYGYEVKERHINSLGISTSKNSVMIENHGYQSGEIVVYSYTGQSVSGLSTERKYYVKKINDDEFKLSLVANSSDNVSGSDFYFKRNQYVDFSSSGIGTHIFQYEPITVNLIGNIGISSYYQAKLQPIFRGEIDSVFVIDGGNNYGSPNIVNHDRKPVINLNSGSSAVVLPLIKNGKIVDIYVSSSGYDYNSPPDIIVEGDGMGVNLTPIVENGRLKDIKVISSGGGYSDKNTNISVIPAGSGAKLEPIVQSWTINLIEKTLIDKQISNDDGILYSGRNKNYGSQYTHGYCPRKLRENVYASKVVGGETIKVSDLVLNENQIEINFNAHSPIIGWAYDGNPIYGPFAYSTERGGKIRSLRSGYSLKKNIDPSRPTTQLYPLGFFVEDYEFTGTGDLDEYNGRFSITPEYPNGVYAYFCTINSSISDSSENKNIQVQLTDSEGIFKGYRRPTFPYVIGNFYKSKPIDFNFDYRSNQDNIDLNEKKWLRNSLPYNFNSKRSRYEYLLDINQIRRNSAYVESTDFGEVDKLEIIHGGKNYKVNDRIYFDKSLSNINADFKVKTISGVPIEKISVEEVVIENVQLVPYKSFIAISTQPHNLYENDIVTFKSKNEFLNKKANIRIIKNNLKLAEDLEPSDVTGIITSIKVSGPILELESNSYYKKDDEIVKVLDVDKKNSSITVERNQFDTVGLTTGSIGSNYEEEPTKFVIDFGLSTNTYNYSRNKQIYFDAEQYVGLGTNYGVGITSTVFVDVSKFRSKVAIGTGSTTTLYFDDSREINKYKLQDYVELVDSTNILFNTTKKQVVAIGKTFVKINFDSSSLSGSGVTSYVNKLDIIKLPTKSIRLPKHGLKPDTPIAYKPPTGGDPIGIGSTVVPGIGLTTLLPPISVCPLYPIPIDEDTIGISTKPNAPIDDGFFFTDPGSNDKSIGQIHSFETIYPKILTGNVIKNVVTVSTASSHGLVAGDYVEINCISGITTTVKVKYDNYYRVLILNPIDFISDNVSIVENTINIPNHNYVNGQKLIHKSDTPCGGLENNKIYYVMKVDNNNFKLTLTHYDSLNYINEINITSQSYGTFEPINPPIFVYQNSQIDFDLSDSSLSYTSNVGIETFSAFDFDVYLDSLFRNRFYSSKQQSKFEISSFGRVGIDSFAKFSLKINENIPTELYYNLKVKKNVLNPLFDIIVDNESQLTNRIIFQKSKYDGRHRVVSTSSTSFTYNLEEYPEINEYISPISKIKYKTDSPNSKGPILDVDVVSRGKYYEKLPGISTIKTIEGTESVIKFSSEKVGSIKNITISDIGFDYNSDLTVRPSIKFPNILSINTLYNIKDITVVSNGKNYFREPDLILIDKISNKILDVKLDYDFKTKKVTILKNSNELNNIQPIIIPTNNSNGYTIKDLTFDEENKQIEITLNIGISTSKDFPFPIGSEFLIENTKVGIGTTRPVSQRGYNSKDYGYTLFKVLEDGFDMQIGGQFPKFRADLSQFLSDGEILGEYDKINSVGKVIPKSDFPIFDVSFIRNKFIKGELVTSKSTYGIVQSYDEINGYLRVSTYKDFIPNEIVKAETSKTAALVVDVSSSNSICNVKSSSLVKKGWNTDVGVLNNSINRVHDNDYYQYFSYSLKSEISFDKWKTPVESLNHASGFKKFSDLIVETDVNAGLNTEQIYSEFSGTADLSGFVSLNCKYDFDLSKDKIKVLDNEIKSDGIIFNSQILQDYIESIGNRVLVLDDISKQFNDQPRTTLFSIVDNFNLSDFRSKKYFVYTRDIIDGDVSQLNVVTLLHNNDYGFINQYGIGRSDFDLGSFDFAIQGTDGNLLFYPVLNRTNEYSLNYFSYSIKDYIDSSGSIEVGNIVNIDSSSVVIPVEEMSEMTIVGISSEYRSSKILIQISTTDGSFYEYAEVTLLNQDSDISILEYGQYCTDSLDERVSITAGAYSASFSGSDMVLNFTRESEHEHLMDKELIIDYIAVSIAKSESGYTQSNSFLFQNGLIESSFVQIPSDPNPGFTTVSSYMSNYGASYFIVTVEDTTNSEYETSEVMLIHDQYDSSVIEYGSISSSGIGTFGTIKDQSEISLTFTPNPNINVEVRSLKHSLGIRDTDIVSDDFIDANNFIIESNDSEYVGTELDIKKSFDLKHKGIDVFRKPFNTFESINISNGISTNVIKLNQNFFVTGEKVKYVPDSDVNPIGIAETVVPGIGLTDKLPKNVYIVKLNELDIQLAATAEDALKFKPKVFDITSVGIGSHHEFISYDQDSKCLITIDNIIQSPVIPSSIITQIAEDVVYGEKVIKVTGISSIFGGDLIQVNDEIMRVNSVGFGNSSTMLVQRRWLGTGIGTHASGDVVRRISGQYKIVDNTINFVSPPYGLYPISSTTNRPDERDYFGISESSSFSGRAFLRSGIENSTIDSYNKNVIFDDLSDYFTGFTESFELKEDKNNVTGISTGNGIILINNIIQIPSKSQTEQDGDYFLDEENSSTTLNFTGKTTTVSYDPNVLDLPLGGSIVTVGSSEGFGYQPLISAGATAIVSVAGTIQSISIGNSGSGYRDKLLTSSGLMDVEVNVGVMTVFNNKMGVEIIGSAIISNGHVVDVNITNPGFGYTSTNPPTVVIDDPLPYTNLPLVYDSVVGFGTEASVDIIVGQGSSVINFELKNVGYGYRRGDMLTVPVGVDGGVPVDESKPFKNFIIFVDSIFTDSFSGWYFGDLIKLDDISPLFDGSTKEFRIFIDENQTSIKSRPGSNIDIEATLLVILNGIIQEPGIGYIFKGGSIITFTEAPKFGDKCAVLFYSGTGEVDIRDVNILETIKVGDDVQIIDGRFTTQLEREVHRINSTDDIDTNIYTNKGIVIDRNVLRPINWCKQTEDKIINGSKVNKSRVNYEPLVNPITNIIKNVGYGDTEIFVESVKTFFDDEREYAETDPSGKNKLIKIIDQTSLVSASATTVIDGDGRVTDIIINNPGNGYKNPPVVTIQSPVGLSHTFGATATSTLSNDGKLSSINLTNNGMGYTIPPNVLIESPSPKVEVVKNVTYEGDQGIIAGIGSTSFVLHPFDVSTTQYQKFVSINERNSSSVTSIAFSKYGHDLYAAGIGSTVYQYYLPNDWELENISYTGLSTNFPGKPSAMAFGSNSIQFFVIIDEIMHEYQLSTPWAIDTISLVDTYPSLGNIKGFSFSNNGYRLYVLEDYRFKVYDLSTSWDISTATLDYINDLYDSFNTSLVMESIFVNNDETKLIIFDNSIKLYEYDLDGSTLSLNNSYQFDYQSNLTFNTTFDSFIKPDGSRIYFPSFDNVNDNGNIIEQYKLGTFDSKALMFDFYIPEDSHFRDNDIISVGIATTGISGIQTGYYFVISDSSIGCISGIKTSINAFDGSIVGVGTQFLDNVYHVADHKIVQQNLVGVGLTYVNRVITCVSNFDCINFDFEIDITFDLTTLSTQFDTNNYKWDSNIRDYFYGNLGNYTWGKIVVQNRKTPNDYEFYENPSIPGITTSALVQRVNPLKYNNYLT